MSGIDEGIITHKQSLSPNAKLASQRKRKLGDERRKAVDEEVCKLKEAGFITEIEYPTWLANVVMVKKKGQRKLANVRRLHRLKQGVSKGPISIAKHRQAH
ncbi:putative retroelement pol polyprotein [Trifolium medium]|uniref:Putative retroelement pol polyprotein n=1 Tax=Trifolium medium TaxID=97028 RepID=A0A392S339_9FABA|nr:putative retroelement pol polyprotein [Trifolium medium]